MSHILSLQLHVQMGLLGGELSGAGDEPATCVLAELCVPRLMLGVGEHQEHVSFVM